MSELDTTAVPDFPGRLRLDAKSFAVIGAGNGMGRQCAHALSQCGATVACVDVDTQRAKHVAGEIGGVPFVADVTDPEQVRQLFDAMVETFGSLHGVVDIVGGSQHVHLLEIDALTWRFNLDVNLTQAVHVIQSSARTLEPGGTLVFVSSVSGLTSAPLHSPYGVAKAGLMALVRTAAVELAPHRLRVNAIAPGMTMTPELVGLFSEVAKEFGQRRIPVGRPGQPFEQAAAMLFLSSDLSSFVNGQVLVVDGGVSATFPYDELQPLVLDKQTSGQVPPGGHVGSTASP